MGRRDGHTSNLSRCKAYSFRSYSADENADDGDTNREPEPVNEESTELTISAPRPRQEQQEQGSESTAAETPIRRRKTDSDQARGGTMSAVHAAFSLPYEPVVEQGTDAETPEFASEEANKN